MVFEAMLRARSADPPFDKTEAISTPQAKANGGRALRNIFLWVSLGLQSSILPTQHDTQINNNIYLVLKSGLYLNFKIFLLKIHSIMYK